MHNLKSLRRRIMPRTLFGRSLLIILVPLLLLQMIVAFVFFDRHWDTMTDKLVEALTGEVAVIVDELQAAKTDAATQHVAREALNLDLAVSVEKGKLEKTPLRPAEELRWFRIDRRVRAALGRKLGVPFLISGHPGTGRDKAVEIGVQIDGGRVARIVCPDRRLSSATTYIFILWLIASALVLFGVAIAFMRNQIRPIRRLAVAAEKFGKGQDVPNFRLEGATEVRQASQAFLEMKERLKRQIEQRTAMLAGVSHDLRTPLTRMKLQLAMAKTGAEADNLRQDVEEMEKMIEAYLTFAKGESDESPEGVDLKSILDRIIAGARRQGADIQETLAEKMPLRARPVAIERALANIVSNAVKYGKHVWLNAYAQGDHYEIAVDDDGPGIPAALRDEVFRPFTRLEKSRNKKTGGIGLGLSIAQDVIHGHGGQIFLEDSNRGGLRVVVRLPI
jgi:two-component system osmolarity sensor histidine kinase EnvZ